MILEVGVPSVIAEMTGAWSAEADIVSCSPILGNYLSDLEGTYLVNPNI